MYLKLPFGCTINNNQSAVLGAMKSSKLHQVGFTVLEVLVSLSILVLTLMVLTSLIRLPFLYFLPQQTCGMPCHTLKMNC